MCSVRASTPSRMSSFAGRSSYSTTGRLLSSRWGSDAELHFSVYSRQDGDTDWTLHSVGTLRRGAPTGALHVPFSELQGECPIEVEPADLHAHPAVLDSCFQELPRGGGRSDQRRPRALPPRR